MLFPLVPLGCGSLGSPMLLIAHCYEPRCAAGAWHASTHCAGGLVCVGKVLKIFAKTRCATSLWAPAIGSRGARPYCCGVVQTCAGEVTGRGVRECADGSSARPHAPSGWPTALVPAPPPLLAQAKALCGIWHTCPRLGTAQAWGRGLKHTSPWKAYAIDLKPH